MKPAQYSKRHFEDTKLLIVQDGGKRLSHTTTARLSNYFQRGDLVVINRSGTLPSSFLGEIERSGKFIEIRLASFQGTHLSDYRHWRAVTFGRGSWRQPTEERGEAPKVRVGERILFGKSLSAVVRSVDPVFYRLIEIEFQSDDLIRALYENGKPIQYSYLKEELQTWDQQTLFSGPPISVEPPSAAFPLSWKLLFGLQKNGVQIASLLHGAGLSSTGDPALDRRLPLDEFYEIPNETLEKIQLAKKNSRRVIALGTTVTRALETAFQNSWRIASRGRTALRLGSSSHLRVVDGLLTGMHEIGTSHAELMLAFSSRDSEMLHAIDQETRDYRSHEYGDLMLLLKQTAPEPQHFLRWLF